MPKKITILVPDETYQELQNLVQLYSADSISSVIAYSITFLNWHENQKKTLSATNSKNT